MYYTEVGYRLADFHLRPKMWYWDWDRSSRPKPVSHGVFSVLW